MSLSHHLKISCSPPNCFHSVGHFRCVQTSVSMNLNYLNAAKEIYAYFLKHNNNVSSYT